MPTGKESSSHGVAKTSNIIEELYLVDVNSCHHILTQVQDAMEKSASSSNVFVCCLIIKVIL